MKKIFKISIITIIFSLFFSITCFCAYTPPADYDYQKAAQCIQNNMQAYEEGDYWISRYPYSGNDPEYVGKYTQNYGISGSTYSVGYHWDNNGSDYIHVVVFGKEPYYLSRYNLDDTKHSDVGLTGVATTSVFWDHTHPTNIDNVVMTNFVLSMGEDWYIYTTSFAASQLNDDYWKCNFMIYSDQTDWFRSMYENNYDITQEGNQGEGSQTGDLPFLAYTLERNTVTTFDGSLPFGQTKLTFKWDYREKDPYKTSPGNYSFDIMAYANFKDSPTGIGHIWDADNYDVNVNNRVYLTQGGQNISINEFSFLYDDIGQAIYSKSNENWDRTSNGTMACGYILGIRTCNNQRSQFSYWKLFKVQAGGYVTSLGKVVDNTGIVKNTSAQNGNDNMNTTNNGTSNYSNNSNTTAGNDTTGTVYQQGNGNLDVGTVISTLQSVVNQVGNIPNILSQLLTFLPAWFTSLIVLSIALFVTIGIVKIVVH